MSGKRCNTRVTSEGFSAAAVMVILGLFDDCGRHVNMFPRLAVDNAVNRCAVDIKSNRHIFNTFPASKRFENRQNVRLNKSADMMPLPVLVSLHPRRGPLSEVIASLLPANLFHSLRDGLRRWFYSQVASCFWSNIKTLAAVCRVVVINPELFTIKQAGLIGYDFDYLETKRFWAVLIPRLAQIWRGFSVILCKRAAMVIPALVDISRASYINAPRVNVGNSIDTGDNVLVSHSSIISQVFTDKNCLCSEEFGREVADSEPEVVEAV